MSVGVDSSGDGLDERAAVGARTRGIEIEDIAMRQPNLDEVFLALTGTPPTPSPTPPPRGLRPRKDRHTS